MKKYLLKQAHINKIFIVGLTVSGMSCSTKSSRELAMNNINDPFLWLEEVDSKEALLWAEEQNKLSLDRLQSDPRFAKTEQSLLKIMEDPEKTPYGTIRGGYVYNFWRDSKHIQGVYRRTSLESYKTSNPEWENLIDFDQLSRDESKTWVYKGVACLAHEMKRCMVYMSNGGSDASYAREYDFIEKKFVEDQAFYIPESKYRFSWIDFDTALVGYDYGAESLTDSGYPRTVRLWKRGSSLENAELVYEGQKKDVSVGAYRTGNPENKFTFYYRSLDFYNVEYSIQFDDDPKLIIPMNLPTHVSLENVYKGKILLRNRKEWKLDASWGIPKKSLKEGSLVAVSVEAFKKKTFENEFSLIWEPSQTSSLENVYVTKSYVLLDLLDNIQSKMLRVSLSESGSWETSSVKVPEQGAVSLGSVSFERDDVFVYYESFLSPETQYLYDLTHEQLLQIRQKKNYFDSSKFVSEQNFARSRDGTQIPYFIVRPKHMISTHLYPVFMYGYGGFEVSQRPRYSAGVGSQWLEKGGVYVVANIRGGGEFGPRWHQAALKENRQKSYDDFHAVAEDLIAKGITDSQKIGIMGGSNGGLLVGVAFTQRPDLYSAVVCAVPLLDMMRFHKLLAGASWMGEYGNPDVENEREYIEKYSPYQNVFQNVKYPEVFFMTSTKDDRVHPAHARKMVAKMKAQGHSVLYYENIEGGHGGAANFKQSAQQEALRYVYLWQKLF